MAKLPTSDEALTSQFGPHLNYPPREGFPGRNEPDKIVETHCCFCGMQCGIELWSRTTKSSASNLGKSSPSTRDGSARKASSVTCKTTTRQAAFPLERVDGAGFKRRLGARFQAERCLKSSAFRANMDPMPSECSRVYP